MDFPKVVPHDSSCLSCIKDDKLKQIALYEEE